MTAHTLFREATTGVALLFLWYGMDVRTKESTRDFVAPVWRSTMKVVAFSLMCALVLATWASPAPQAIDWLGLLFMISGTMCVVAAKRALGTEHTFTGQFREHPQLVTHGIYRFTRNPLYLGVFQYQFGALLCAVHWIPRLSPHAFPYVLGALSIGLAYAVCFNWTMAVREAQQLEHSLGDVYRRYSSEVPFLVPFTGAPGANIRRRASAHRLQRRLFRLDADEGLSGQGGWFEGHPLGTQLLNAYTLLIPGGERFIIRSCRHRIDRAEPALQEELQQLFFQEGSHSREHGRMVAAMRAEGLGLQTASRLIDWVSYQFLEPLTPFNLRLATAAAIEHHNAVIATFFLTDGLLRDVRYGELRRLLLWHFAEEIEHKETVFKLLERVTPSRFLRACGLVVSGITFLGYLAVLTLLFGVKTGAAFTPGFWREVLSYCRGRKGLVGMLMTESWRYATPHFHPSVEDSRVLLGDALAELERLGVERPKRQPTPTNRAIPVAFRNRMAPTLDRVTSLSSNTFFGASIVSYDGNRVRSEDSSKLNFCTYSYLGLLGDPRIQEAAGNALERFGTGTHGVRLFGGNLKIYETLEARIARFFQREAAITFSAGFMTNVSVIAALVGKEDHVLSDIRNHASIVDGCRLSGATVTFFKHNDMDDLTRKLDRLPHDARRLIVVDAVFSMDGDIAPLQKLIALRDGHPNTLLMVDEAHSLGVLGRRGRGIEEHFDCRGQVDVLMGTLSKTIPAQGGYVTGSRDLITYLRFSARGFIFSAPLSPASAAAATVAFDVIEQEGAVRRARLMANVYRFIGRLRRAGFHVGNTESAIIPVIVGSESLAFDIARRCHEEGIHVMPVASPAVARGTERLRMNVTCNHTHSELDQAVTVLTRARTACAMDVSSVVVPGRPHRAIA